MCLTITQPWFMARGPLRLIPHTTSLQLPDTLPVRQFATGVAFGVGYAVGRWAYGGNYWGSNCNWGNNNINVNRNVNVNNWQHNSYHRRGVAYNNTNGMAAKLDVISAAAAAMRFC